METIIVEFDEGGNPVVTAQGIKGKGCKAVTAAIEAALGTTTGDKTTSEYFAPEVKKERKLGR